MQLSWGACFIISLGSRQVHGGEKKKNYSNHFAWANSTERMGSLRAETGEEEALIPMCGTKHLHSASRVGTVCWQSRPWNHEESQNIGPGTM